MAEEDCEDNEALIETLEILTDDEALSQLRQSVQELKDGKTIPWDEAKAAL